MAKKPDYIEKAKSSPTFCILPFITLHNRVNGDFSFCCKSHPKGFLPLGNIKNTTMKKVWNNNEAKKIRHQMLNGQKPSACDLCWKMEEKGIMSKRLQNYSPKSRNFEKQSSILKHLNEDCELPFEISRLDVELSNLCNLRCRMCNINYSTKWAKDHEAVKHLTEHLLVSNPKVDRHLVQNRYNYWEKSGKYSKEIVELLPHLSLIDFSGGEPSIDPYYYDFLKLLLPYSHKISLSYSTNLHKHFQKDISELWKKFKDVSITVSVDGIGDIYNYIRQDADFERLKTNISNLRKSQCADELGGAFCLQIYNAFSICETFDYFINEFHFDVIYFNTVGENPCLDSRIIPHRLKQDVISKMKRYYNDIDNKKWTPQIKKHVKKYIKQSIDFLNSNYKICVTQAKDFIEFSDILDQRQNVKYTWRELLPDLAEEIEKMQRNGSFSETKLHLCN